MIELLAMCERKTEWRNVCCKKDKFNPFANNKNSLKVCNYSMIYTHVKCKFYGKFLWQTVLRIEIKHGEVCAFARHKFPIDT